MKNLKFVVLLVLTMLVFSACTEPAAVEPDPQETVVKAGFIYVAPIGVEGFTYAHDQGRLYLEEQLGIETVYQENVPETAEVENVIANMVDQGCNVIFGTSYGFGEFMMNVAADYPDVAFLHCSGGDSTDNLNNYFGRMYEPRFLSGLVAGLATETNKIGYVAAYAIPEVIRGINAFTLGVQAVNPEAEVDVVWTNTWYDPANEKAAALSLIDNGADVIAQHQDTASPQAAANDRGVKSIGYHSDMEAQAPNAYMTAPIWDFTEYYKSEVEKVIAGEWTPVNVWLGMKDGMVLLDDLTANAPAEAADIVADYQARIIAGEFNVFGGVITKQDGTTIGAEGEVLSDGDLLGMNYFIKGVNGVIE